MIHENRKYRSQNEVGNPPYKTHMKLTISNIQSQDFGTLLSLIIALYFLGQIYLLLWLCFSGIYKCMAKNPSELYLIQNLKLF